MGMRDVYGHGVHFHHVQGGFRNGGFLLYQPLNHLVNVPQGLRLGIAPGVSSSLSGLTVPNLVSR